jgi:hypothetical protein
MGNSANANATSFSYGPDGERAGKAFGSSTTRYFAGDELLADAANPQGLLTSHFSREHSGVPCETHLIESCQRLFSNEHRARRLELFNLKQFLSLPGCFWDPARRRPWGKSVNDRNPIVCTVTETTGTGYGATHRIPATSGTT